MTEWDSNERLTSTHVISRVDHGSSHPAGAGEWYPATLLYLSGGWLSCQRPPFKLNEADLRLVAQAARSRSEAKAKHEKLLGTVRIDAEGRPAYSTTKSIHKTPQAEVRRWRCSPNASRDGPPPTPWLERICNTRLGSAKGRGEADVVMREWWRCPSSVSPERASRQRDRPAVDGVNISTGRRGWAVQLGPAGTYNNNAAADKAVNKGGLINPKLL
ncbi:hypothetical protein EDB86DRAFT_2828107 [Lactarius hatsudake]|nr:hypothetical protein EDB86DRAFT_2828107 [Lactarius hatsudake]